MYSLQRTSKIEELIDLYNSTDYYVAEHFVDFSLKRMLLYLIKNSGKIEDIIVIRRK
mgnify:CR=1 FL=1